MDTVSKLSAIKNWLGTGSINIFGLPMSGKDTVGVRLSEDLDAKFLSSGMMIRAVEKEAGTDITGTGVLTPTNMFYDIVLPYFGRENLNGYPLVLSSVGRWSGEEEEVMKRLELTNHETKAVVWLSLSEDDVLSRWDAVQTLQDRGDRTDDRDRRVFLTRIAEFKNKTIPVLQKYKDLGLLVQINADANREEVYNNVIDGIYNFIKA